MMEWKKYYLDAILVPLSFMIIAGYHAWLWHRVRNQPLTTFIAINATARRFWVSSIIKDNDKKNILAVQTIRNTIMGSTLMATVSILLTTGLAAVLSSTYSIKKPLSDSVLGAHGELVMALKYVVLLTIFVSSFFCHYLSINYINEVNYLINININVNVNVNDVTVQQQPSDQYKSTTAATTMIRPEYVAELIEKSAALSTVGNRVFYTALPMLLWIFGPVLVFLCSVALVPLLYSVDIVKTTTISSISMKGTSKANIGSINDGGDLFLL